MTENRRLLLLSGAVIAIFGLLGAWLVRAGRLEERKGALLRALAGRMTAEMADLEASDPWPPAEGNAATLYEEARALLPKDESRLVQSLHASQRMRSFWDGVPGDLEAWVADHSQVLALVERAGMRDRCRWALSYGPPGPAWFTPVPKGPPVSREAMDWFLDLLAIRGRIALMERKVAEAARDAVLLQRLARHCQAAGMDVDGAVDGALERACVLLEGILDRPDLDGATARKVASGLLDASAFRDGESRLPRRRLLYQDGQTWLFLDGRNRGNAFLVRKLNRLSVEGDLWRVSHADLDVLETAADKREAERQEARRGRPRRAGPVPRAARLGVLRTAFAVRAFERYTGSLPSGLEALVPAFLPEVPRDPCADGPMHYSTRPGGWSVWSVGTLEMWDWQNRSPHMVPVDLRIDFPPAR